MHQMNAQTLRRPAWLFDRHDRLSALANRAREMAEALHRERCDQFHDRSTADRLAARMAIYEARFRTFARCARESRWESKALATWRHFVQ